MCLSEWIRARRIFMHWIIRVLFFKKKKFPNNALYGYWSEHVFPFLYRYALQICQIASGSCLPPFGNNSLRFFPACLVHLTFVALRRKSESLRSVEIWYLPSGYTKGAERVFQSSRSKLGINRINRKFHIPNMFRTICGKDKDFLRLPKILRVRCCNRSMTYCTLEEKRAHSCCFLHFIHSMKCGQLTKKGFSHPRPIT